MRVLCYFLHNVSVNLKLLQEMKSINVTTKCHGCLNPLLAFLTYGGAPQNGRGGLSASTTLPVYEKGACTPGSQTEAALLGPGLLGPTSTSS